MDSTRYVQEMEKRIPTLRMERGEYVGRLDGTYTVDVGGGRIPAAMMCPPPQVGDAVHVWCMNGQWFVMGMVVQPPSEGAVGFVTASDAQVITDDGTFMVPLFVGQTPASGDVVELGYGEQGLFILGRRSVAVVPPVAPPAPAVAGGARTTIFRATGSGSAKRGSDDWFTNEVHASASNVGVFVYGSKVRDTLAAAKSVAKVEIWLRTVRDSGNQPLIGVHPLERRAGPTPMIAQRKPLADPLNGWHDITEFAASLRAGGGVGFDGAGYTYFEGIPFDGKAGDNEAGRLRVRYTI